MRVGLVLTTFVFAVVAGLTTMPARAMDGCLPPAGFMRSVQGQVEIRRGAADWRPAALDEPLCAGDLIRVGDRSRALASFANLTERIDQNTTLSLTYVPEDKPSVVGLLEGAVYFFSRKPRSSRSTRRSSTPRSRAPSSWSGSSRSGRCSPCSTAGSRRAMLRAN